jgi:hypothetical protein
MKYLKVMVGLGLIPLGVFAGSLIRLGGGNAAILGGILGVILCCLLFWSAPRWLGSDKPGESYQANNADKQAIGNTVKSAQEAHIEDEIVLRGIDHYGF